MDPQPRRPVWKTVLACFSIAANALCAGGIFTFPLVSAALASHTKLTQPQLTTIVLAAMMSQYPLAALAGKVIDRKGPATCSLIAACFFSISFGAFAIETANPTKSTLDLFHRLTFCYLIAGFGTVFSYFSSLFAASKMFPNHLGIASGTSMALFGLSPLFLSLIASAYFTDANSGLLNVSRYKASLAILTGVVYIFGAYSLRGLAGNTNSMPNREREDGNEHTALLPRRADTDSQVDGSVLTLLRDKNFWLLAIFCAFLFGASEMVISNIGTIVLSFPPTSSVPRVANFTENSTSYQVRLLSISNTVSRIVAGPLADFVSPVASYLPSGVPAYARKHRVSRVVFLSGSALLLAATFFWMEYGVTSREALWVLSVGTGLGYGAFFTILPSIISSVWGMENLGRNFGLLLYAPFIGTPSFSYLYAFVSDVHSQGASICVGRNCWQLTFWVTFSTSICGLFISVILWRTWKGLV